MVKKILAGILCAATMITLSVGCSGGAAPGASTDPSAKITGNTGEVKLEKGDKYAVMTIKDYGDITIKLYPDAAPKGTQNFIDLANSGFYNGKTFHRNLKQFIENMDDATKAKYKEVGGTPSLDGNYTVFGQTVDGFDVLDKISAVEVETNDAMGGKEVSKPKTEIIIEKVEIKDYE